MPCTSLVHAVAPVLLALANPLNLFVEFPLSTAATVSSWPLALMTGIPDPQKSRHTFNRLQALMPRQRSVISATTNPPLRPLKVTDAYR